MCHKIWCDVKFWKVFRFWGELVSIFFLQNGHCRIFFCIWQILSNYGLTRLKRFVSQITGKLYNYLFILSIFNTSYMCCKIRCDEKSEKLYKCCKTKQDPYIRMATGRVWIGWSLRAPKTETRSRNPKPKPKPIRMEIQYQNQTCGYPKPERTDTRNQNGYPKPTDI